MYSRTFPEVDRFWQKNIFQKCTNVKLKPANVGVILTVVPYSLMVYSAFNTQFWRVDRVHYVDPTTCSDPVGIM